MSRAEKRFVFIFLNVMGGVPSFYRNIINGQRIVSPELIRVILLNNKEDTRPKFVDDLNASEVITFDYSDKENQYYIQKRLGKIIGDCSGSVITDHSLSLQTVNLFNRNRTVFHLIHDYYYVNQNIQMGDMVDVAIAHSSFFTDAVFASNPALFYGRSFYIPYGVQQLQTMPVKNNAVLNLVFIGRLDESKGVMLLHEIERKLKEKVVQVNWTVIGKGPKKKELVKQWESENNISFYEPDTTADVYEILKSQDIFVFPTVFEGTPVSILECLANGVVTITNDLPGGIRDIVKTQIGFRCELNNIDQYVEIIISLHNDRQLLKQLQANSFALAASDYDINKNADNYFRTFLKFDEFKRSYKKSSFKMSRLDRSVFPNAIVKFIRSIR